MQTLQIKTDEYPELFNELNSLFQEMKNESSPNSACHFTLAAIQNLLYHGDKLTPQGLQNWVDTTDQANISLIKENTIQKMELDYIRKVSKGISQYGTYENYKSSLTYSVLNKIYRERVKQC
jgi:hypothetical protein